MRRFKSPDYYFEQMTLKRRMVVIFATSTLVPFICAALISYNAMSTILTSNLESGVRSNLRQVQLSLENTISNLNHVSQQLAFQGSVGKKLELYLTATEPFERARLVEEIHTELNLITFTNPSIGLAMYYFRDDGTFLFENAGIKEDFSVDRLPLIDEYYRITYFGPHVSNERYNNQYVLSALRKVDLPERDDAYVYIESGFKLTQNILESDRIAEHSFHLILDKEDRIAYSEVPSLFAENIRFPAGGGGQTSGLLKDHYWFKRTSNQGWSIVSLIPKAEYNKEKNRWVVWMVYLSLLFGVLSMIVSWLLWRMVYRPLQQFNSEIRLMSQSHFHTRAARTKIPEFDFLLKQFQNMKKQIADLFREVEQKEKRRADLEVEKLLYQINPHFLMNTLDTAHWLAVMNGQKEIDRLVTSLNKLLYYNLGKLGQASTIREEIDSLKQYLILQQIRYDFEFDVRIHADDDVLDVPVPRFILQPLLENALYHGLNDEGYIRVEVKQSGDKVVIAVHDNGTGISEEEIRKLLNQEQVEQRKAGMGIGMNYVRRMIENQYGDEARLEIKSVPGEGTSVYLTLPAKEVEPRDQRAGR